MIAAFMFGRTTFQRHCQAVALFEPDVVLAPIGFNWQIAVALVPGSTARQ